MKHLINIRVRVADSHNESILWTWNQTLFILLAPLHLIDLPYTDHILAWHVCVSFTIIVNCFCQAVHTIDLALKLNATRSLCYWHRQHDTTRHHVTGYRIAVPTNVVWYATDVIRTTKQWRLDQRWSAVGHAHEYVRAGRSSCNRPLRFVAESWLMALQDVASAAV